MDNPHFTIIIPVFNEAENLGRLKEALDEYFSVTPVSSRVLFIDDGSTDASPAILREICVKSGDYSWRSLDRNYGLSTALKAGFDHCNTPWAGYLDADLQTSPMDFMLCFPYMDHCQMVNGIRVHRSDGLIKRISSRIANRFRNWLIKDGIKDTCCPLKVMETAAIRRIPFFNGMHRFLPALVQLHGGRVKEVEVTHHPRLAGKAKYHLWNRLFHPLIDTLMLAWFRQRQIAYRTRVQYTRDSPSKEKALTDE